MDAPVCLIENTPDGKFVINEEAAELLASISQPVVVVAIAGLYRTGKSYLMNKLAGETSGFALGSMLQACTKGIWMWCIPHPEKPDQTLVLLDTEGLGDVEKGDSTNDTWIFALALLLSSTLVYNSKGAIDQPALNELHYVTELTECIKAKASSRENAMDGLEDSAEFVRFFPDFIWSLRDFTLCLELHGQPITADEYLEHALTLKQGDTPAIEKCNLPRKCIREYFPTRKCFIFECPTSRKNLPRLEQMQESELDPDFVEQAAQFCNYVYRTSKAKTIPGGHVLNGCLLANLAKTYVDTIQSGRVPCLENAVLALAKIENPAVVAEATARYVELMERRLRLPTETLEELLWIHAGCEEEALRVFMARAFKDDTHEFQAQLKNTLGQKMEEYRKNNELESSKCSEAVLASVCQELEEGIRSGVYARPGGHKHFLEDLSKLEQRYRQEPNKGVMAEAILQQYLKDKEQIGATILQCDTALTQKEQEEAEAKAKAEETERELARQRQELAELRQRLQDEQRRSEMSGWERMLQEFWDDLHSSGEWRNLRKMNQGKQQLLEELLEQENQTVGHLFSGRNDTLRLQFRGEPNGQNEENDDKLRLRFQREPNGQNEENDNTLRLQFQGEPNGQNEENDNTLRLRFQREPNGQNEENEQQNEISRAGSGFWGTIMSWFQGWFWNGENERQNENSRAGSGFWGTIMSWFQGWFWNGGNERQNENSRAGSGFWGTVMGWLFQRRFRFASLLTIFLFISVIIILITVI